MKAARKFAVVLDVGTTTVRAMAFDGANQVIAKASECLNKNFPKQGWVEQDPQQLIDLTTKVLCSVIGPGGLDPKSCIGIGITNQRETTILWDERTGRAAYPAIVWEDTRAAAWCSRLRPENETTIRSLTGLAIDPYFSATKISWVLAHVPAARELLEQEKLRFGTVDTWLIWNLCAGHPHVTDESNAHRTLLVNAKTRNWDKRLLEIFKIPQAILPTIVPSRHVFGRLDKSIVGRGITVLAVCGDQQSSLYAAWHESNDRHPTKITYGTGTFIDQVAGNSFRPQEGFFSQIIPALGGGSAYAIEGKVARGAREVDTLLGDDIRLRRFLKRLAKLADAYVKRLPHRPKTIVIDGGVSRDGIVGDYQAKVSGVKTKPLSVFDGTALGTAYLVWEQARRKK